MQNAQTTRNNHAPKNGQHGRSGKTKPSRYFVEGRIPPDVETAQKRLVQIKEEHKRASNLVNNATDINTERQNCRKKFLEHTEKEILLLTKWIEDDTTDETYGAAKAPMTAREKILDTLNFLTALNKRGLLLTEEQLILDVLIDYRTQG